MENALIYQVQLLLSYNKISFDKEELAFQIQSHPSYPSLHAITGVLEHFGIDNLALDIPPTQEVLDQLPKTFLAQVATDNGKDFAIVINRGQKAEVIMDSKTKSIVPTTVFLEKFTGIIVAVEKTAATPEIIKNSSIARKGLLSLLGVVLASLIFLSSPSVSEISYLLLAIVGTFISLAIVKQQLGLQTDIGNAFCSSTDTTKDCNTVLSSRGATIFNTFKLSDLSIIYFSGLTLSIVASIVLNYNLSHLLAVSLLATPIIIYSIYYQYAFAKAWCPLCLIIAGILGLQGIISGFYFSEILSMSIKSLLISIGSFTTSIAIWSFVYPKIESLKNLKQIKIEYFKFKRNFELFKTVLNKSPKIDTKIPFTSEIIFGNKKAPLSIVIITSPFCGHCKPVHTLIEDILKSKRDQVAITIRFSVSTKDKETDLYKITSRLTEIYHTSGKEDCMQAMHDIYDGMDLENWLSQWGVCEKSILYGEVLSAQNEWCLSHSINFTPEILINGKSFPKEYDRKDLTFFIEDLLEDCTSNYTEPAVQIH